MSIVTHHIPVTTGQPHHMTLRLVQSYGAPIPNGQYMIEGSILQDEMTVPISSTQSASSGILLTIPPLYPGNHPYSLQIKNKTTNATFPILQGNCLVSELIDTDTLDNTSIEQITVTLKEDLSDIIVTVQIAPDITAAALNAVAAASGIISDIRKTAELETNKAVAAINRSATEGKTLIQTARNEALDNINQTGTTACASVQKTAAAGQTAIQTAQAAATTAVDTAKNNALSSIASTVTTGKSDIQTAQSAATDAIAAAKNDALSAITEAVEAGQAQFATSIDEILSNETLIARLKTACGIPALETAIVGKVDSTALNAYIPYSKIGRALTKAADGTVDVDLSNYTGTTVNIIGTTSACIGQSSNNRFESTSSVTICKHASRSEIASGTSIMRVQPSAFHIQNGELATDSKITAGNNGILAMQAKSEIAMRALSGTYPGIFLNGPDHKGLIVISNSTTSYTPVAYICEPGITLYKYVTFTQGHN